MARSKKTKGVSGIRPGKKLTGQKAARVEAQFVQATQAHQQGRSAEAEALYRQIIKLHPAHADAWQLLGVICHQTGRNHEAINSLQRAVRLNPRVDFYQLNLARALKAERRYAEAERAVKQALSLKPSGVAYSLLGSVQLEQGAYAAGLSAVETALELMPEDPISWNLKGLLLQRLRQPQQAVESFRQAIAHDPDYGIAYNNLGNQLRLLGQFDAAKAQLDQALRRLPNQPDVCLNQAHLLVQRRDYLQAARLYHKAIELAGGIGARTLDWVVQEATALFLSGQVAQAIQRCDQALVIQPDYSAVVSYRLALLCYHEVDAERLAQQHFDWGVAQARQIPQPELPTDRTRIRVGYVSPDFKQHSVGGFFKPILAHHDRQQFELFCYSNVAIADTQTAWFETHSDHWRDIRGLDTAQAVERIKQDNLHLLVDLTGHTTEHRLDLFCQRPAAIQLTYLGYPNTTGLDCIDYRITDYQADPEGLTESQYTETLLRLPGAFFCFEPPASAPPVNSTPALENGFITFGSFNNLAKVCERTIELWAGLLLRLPDARLLMQTPALGEAATRQRIADRFAALGVSAERLELLDSSSFEEHLKLHHRVDIVLDTLLWNGHTTTCNSLWMGVPHLVMKGDRHASRMGFSILSQLQLEDWVADSEQQYLDLAVAKSADIEALDLLRQQMRQRLQDSVMLDCEGFTRGLERAYLELLQ